MLLHRLLPLSGLLLVVTVVLSGCGAVESPPPPSRVIVLGLDGLDPRAIDLLGREGRLPNLDRIRQEGAWGPLQASMPMLSPILWTTMATGRTPNEHGIAQFAIEPAGGGEKQPVTSTLRRVEAIWNIVSRSDRRVGVVGWWATWPPEPVNGTIVSDHAAYHFLFDQGAAVGGSTTGSSWVSPDSAEPRLRPLIRSPESVSYEEASRYISVPEEEYREAAGFKNDIGHLRWAVASANTYRDIGLELWKREQPDLLMVYVEGTDSVSHLFGHLFRVGELSGELALQQARFGRAVEGVYELADEIVGDYLAQMDDATTLVVLSDHGFKLGQLHEDPTVSTSMRRVSADYHAPLGIIGAIGAGVRPGAITGATQIDVCPTLLALLRLPASEEMPGRILEFVDPDSVVSRIASWEPEDRRRDRASRDPESDSAVSFQVLSHLEALGYLESSEAEATQPTDSQVDLMLQAGQYAEAEREYRRLIASDPDDASLHLNLGVALTQQGRFQDANASFEDAVRIDPTLALGWFNIGILAERLGDLARAVSAFRLALQADGSMEQARNALARLTGSPMLYPPRNPQEQQAVQLCLQSSVAAKRGAYDQAGDLLDEAERLAPELGMVFLYQANVAYLQRDRETAENALERLLELEPGNAVVRHNLATLRQQASSQADSGPTP